MTGITGMAGLAGLAGLVGLVGLALLLVDLRCVTFLVAGAVLVGLLPVAGDVLVAMLAAVAVAWVAAPWNPKLVEFMESVLQARRHPHCTQRVVLRDGVRECVRVRVLTCADSAQHTLLLLRRRVLWHVQLACVCLATCACNGQHRRNTAVRVAPANCASGAPRGEMRIFMIIEWRADAHVPCGGCAVEAIVDGTGPAPAANPTATRTATGVLVRHGGQPCGSLVLQAPDKEPCMVCAGPLIFGSSSKSRMAKALYSL